MAPSTIDRPNRTPQGVASTDAIFGKLRSLRWRIALWLAVDGVCRVLLLLLVVIAVDLFVDWQFSMDRPQRMVVMGLVGAGLSLVAYRHLLRPLSHKLSDDALCLMVERRYRELGDGLISAIQLSRDVQSAEHGASSTLVAATIERGVTSAMPVDFRGVLRQGRFTVNVVLAFALGLALAGITLAIAQTDTMSIWFDRNVLLSDRPWPQDFYLTFDGASDGVLRVPRGEPWPLGVSLRLARKDVIAPEEVSYDLRSAADFHSERMERGDGGSRFLGKLPAIDAPAEVRAIAQGGDTGWMRLMPVDRPRVESLQLAITPPKYTGGGRESLAEGKGPYAILPGSRLHIAGLANKPLSQATVSHGATKVTMKVNDRRFSCDLEYGADSAGIYAVELIDTEQMPLPSQGGKGPLASRAPVQFTVRTRVDRLPVVKVRMTGIGGLITSHARLPLSIAVDDDFAVVDASIHYRYRGPAEGDSGLSNAIRPPGLEKQLGGREVRIDHVLDVGALKVPAGAEFSLDVRAVDNNDVTPPRTGTSSATVLRVVSDEEFRADLLRREKEQRQEIERLQKLFVGIVADTRELGRGGADDQPWPAKTEQSAARVAREQKGMGPALGMVARRIDELLTETANNGLEAENGPLAQRLRSHVHAPLMRIADVSIPAVVRSLDEARRQSARSAQRNEALAAALAGQARIETELNQILKYMIKAEDYQFVLSLIMELQHSQSDVLNRAEKERLERIKRIFEQGGAGVDK